MELRLVPAARGEDVGERVHRVPHLFVAQEQRRKTEAHGVRRAEVRQDAAHAERLHDGIAFRNAQAHMTAAFCVVFRRQHLQPQRLGPRNRDRAELAGFRLKLWQSRAVEYIERTVERRQRQDRRRAAGEPGGAVFRLVRAFERKRGCVTHPARERRVEPRSDAARRVYESGRSGAAVQVFVGASRREQRAAGTKRQVKNAGRVAQVPNDQRAMPAGFRFKRGDVGNFAGPVVHDAANEDPAR